MKSSCIYKCNECNQVYYKKFDFLEHQNIHSNETPFMCINCKKSFKLVTEYVNHIKSQHIEEDVDGNTSEECLKNSESSKHETSGGSTEIETSNIGKALEKFLKFKNPQKDPGKSKIPNANKCECCACQIKHRHYYYQNKENLKCKNCMKKFSTRGMLSKHACFISSSGGSFQCSCSQTFTEVSLFKAHVGSKPYSCCSCSMKFNTITNLIRHVRTHTNQKPYVCKDCGRGFSQSANLRNHLSVHLGVAAIKCNKCNFSCKTYNGLLKHKKKHQEGFLNQNYVDGRKNSSKKSTCPICNKQFLFKRNMGMHMKIHSNNTSSLCTECGKVFDSRSKLTSHHKACHMEPSVCKTCGKVFASAVLLGAHEKIHVNVKSFSCNVCQKTFATKNYLTQHIKTHSNKKQFSCSKCGKLFKVSASLKYHSNICTS